MAKKRRSWTADEKMEIVLAGLKEENTVAEICRRHDIHQSQYYKWRDIFLERGREGLEGRSENQKVKKLRKELDDYKKMVGELKMQNEILKKTFRIREER